VEGLDYLSFTGKGKIYLFDEAHQLSKDAFAALLKSMEDPLPGSLDKKLVCIFCTTAPEKMEHAVATRCGPSFVVRAVSVEEVAKRLGVICWSEGIQYEDGALELIAEVCECGIRESIMALEGVSVLGVVTKARVSSYLQLDANALCLEVLCQIGSEGEVAPALRSLLDVLSPSSAYKALAKASLLAYELHFGLGVPEGHWDRESLKLLGEEKGATLLNYAQLFATRPGHPTSSMLVCDILALSRYGVAQIQGHSGVFFAPVSLADSKPSPPRKAELKVDRPEPGQPDVVDSRNLTRNGQYLMPSARPNRGTGGVNPADLPSKDWGASKAATVGGTGEDAIRAFQEGFIQGKNFAGEIGPPAAEKLTGVEGSDV